MEEFEPVGVAEVCEVERMSWAVFRQSRIAECEKATMTLSEMDIVRKVDLGILGPSTEMPPQEKNVLKMFDEIEQDIKAGKINCDEMRRRLSRLSSLCAALWDLKLGKARQLGKTQTRQLAEEIAQANSISHEEAEMLLATDPDSQPAYNRFVVLAASESLRAAIWAMADRKFSWLQGMRYRAAAISSNGTTELFQRYDAAEEGKYSRALNRLLHLQRLRKSRQSNSEEATFLPTSIKQTGGPAIQR
jgi:hypothetical protein